MPRSKALRQIATIAGLAAAYFAAGELGVQLAATHTSAAVWPCAGLAVAGLLLFGYEVWPGILLGALLLNLTTVGKPPVAVGIALGSTLEALAATYLVTRFARGHAACERARDFFKFAALAGPVSAIVGATIAATSLVQGGLLAPEQFWATWARWWLGDAAAVVLAAPLVLLWWEDPRVRGTLEQALEAALLFFGLSATALVVFGGMFGNGPQSYALEALCIPFLLWAAFRFGRREMATALGVLAGIAIGTTARGAGPFAADDAQSALLRLALFLGILAAFGMALSAEVAERRAAEERARNLAISDPLTGLANYRQFVEALESEIKRFGRTERPFVVLLLDLDGLKKINDAHGHIAGSRALCRMADMLRLYSREMDTAARYGGDEFVLILPETDAEAARLVAQRISKRLAEDGEEPKLSVSIGMAVCPEDGETIPAILNAADRDLYREKGVPRRRFVLPS